MANLRRYYLVLILAFVFLAPVSGQSPDQLYTGGRQAFTDGLWPTAASQFSRLLREYPEDVRADSAAYMAAVAYYNAGDNRRCIEILRTFPRRYPDSAWNRRVAYWEGLAHYGNENWRDAAAAFQRQAGLREEQAYRERSLLYLGACRENLEDWGAAENAYAELIRDGGNRDITARAIFRLGQIRLADERPGEALESFMRLAYDYPESPHAADADYWIGESNRRLGRDDGALESYRNFLYSVYDSPYRDHALLEASRLAAAAGEDDEALAYLDLRDDERRSGTDPDAAAAMRIRAPAFLRTGRLREAREAYAAILRSPVDTAERQSAAFNLAQTWLGTDGEINAVDYLEQAFRGPDDRIVADAMYGAGQILLLEGRTEGAGHLETFASRFTGDSRREEALRLAVKARRDDGDDRRAAESLNLLIRDYPRSGEMPAYLFLRAEMRLDAGDSTAALEDYGRIVDSHADSGYAADAYSRIGFVYAGRREHARAAGYYLEAARIGGGADGGPDARRAVYSAGVAFLNAGAFERAERQFVALTENPRGAWGVEAAYHMGEARYDRGDFPGAREAYRIAVRYGEGEWAYEAAYALGWTWFRESEWIEAEKAFANSSDFAQTPEQRMRSMYRVGLCRASSGDWPAAMGPYGEAVAWGGGDWREEALYQYAWALLNLGEEDRAMEISETLASENPGSDLPADLLFRMGEEALAAGDQPSAVSWFDACRDRYPESPTARRAGLSAANTVRDNGDPAEAARRYGEWVADNPDDPAAVAAVRSWAECLRDDGDPRAADAALERVSQLFGGDAAAAVPLVLVRARISGIPSDSIDRLETIAEDGQLPAADRAEALLLRAHRYRIDGKPGRSRQIYETIIRDIPGRLGAEAQEGLAASFADEGRIDEAAEAYLAVPYLYPEEKELGARALREAERLYREAGRDEEAEKVRLRIAGNG